MEWLIPAQIAAVIASTVLVAVFGYLYAIGREDYLGLWAGAWVAHLGRTALEVVDAFAVDSVSPLLLGGAHLLNIASGVLLLAGTWRFLGRRVSPWWYVPAAAAAVWTIIAVATGASTFVASVPGFVFLGLASIATGFAWLSSAAGSWARLSGLVFVLWGIHRLDYPFMRGVEWFAPVGYALGAFFAQLVAFTVLVAHFEKGRTSLSDSERRYRELFDKSGSVMLLIDPQDGALVDANEAAQEYYGWSHEELTSMRISDINTLSSEELSAEMAAASVEKRTHFLFAHRHSDGTVSDVEVYTGPADVGDRRLLYSIVHDITARRQAERELAEYKAGLEELVEHRTQQLTEASERLEGSQRTKDAFLANMSHELRTPLNSIIGFSGLLAGGHAGSLTPEQARQAEMIQASGRRLLALINDLLDVSAIDSGRTTPSFAVVDVCELIGSFARMIEPLCREKSLSLSVDGCGAADSLLLVTDSRLLEQVLWNLVGNAIKFTDTGGVRLSVSSEPGGAAIAVSDTGPGIREEDLDRVFEDFTQLEAVHGAKNLGTGLGLSIARRLSAMLDGTLEVASEPGRGSTFTVHLVDHGRSRGADTSPACD